MSGQITEVEARIASAGDLRELVTAMRGVAAARVSQGEAALGAISTYADGVGAALSDALALTSAAPRDPPPATARRRGLVLLASEHGFVGAFDEPLFALARQYAGAAPLLVIGRRGAQTAQDSGLAPDWTAPQPSRVRAVPGAAARIATALYRLIARHKPEGIDVIYPRPLAGGRAEAAVVSLLPLDLGRFPPRHAAVSPLTTLAPARLVERLVQEYVVAELSRIVMASFIGENGARLATMRAARRNIDERLETLTDEAHRLRQDDITIELLDIVAGGAAQTPP